jgi:hypothetical protein
LLDKIPFEVVLVIITGLEQRLKNLDSGLEIFSERILERQKQINGRIKIIQSTIDYLEDNDLYIHVEEYQKQLNQSKTEFEKMLSQAQCS